MEFIANSALFVGSGLVLLLCLWALVMSIARPSCHKTATLFGDNRCQNGGCGSCLDKYSKGCPRLKIRF